MYHSSRIPNFENFLDEDEPSDSKTFFCTPSTAYTHAVELVKPTQPTLQHMVGVILILFMHPRIGIRRFDSTKCLSKVCTISYYLIVDSNIEKSQ